MRWIRPLVLLLLLATSACYAGLQVYDNVFVDHKAPVITCEKDLIKVKVSAREKKLLKKMTAKDNRDGDLTDQIYIEKIGPFLSDGTREVSYVVCDSSNNVGRYTRKLKYKDYRSPRIYLSQPLIYRAGVQVDLLENMTADDVLDGDISNRIQSVNTTLFLAAPQEGDYEITFQAANTAGDTITMNLPVEVVDSAREAAIPRVGLTEYIAYVEEGKDFSPFDYVESVNLRSRTYPVSDESDHVWADADYQISGLISDYSFETTNKPPEVLFYSDIICDDSAVDTSKKGVYQVRYTVTTEDGVSGDIYLAVVVY